MTSRLQVNLTSRVDASDDDALLLALSPAERIGMMWSLAIDAWSLPWLVTLRVKCNPSMLNPDYRDILSAFTDASVEFLVVGAYAVAAHGVPRATGDIDLFVRPTLENAQRVWDALLAFDARLDRVEVADFAREGTILQVGVVPRRIDLITAIEGVSFETAWGGRKDVELDGVRLPVIGLNELLTNKRGVGLPQDKADVERLQSLQRRAARP